MQNEWRDNNENLKQSDSDLFIKIWTSPRYVLKYINDHEYDKYINVLLFLAGISRAFDRASVKGMGDTFPLWGIILICIILGGLLGWISFYIYAVLVSAAGKLFDGKGDSYSILRIFSYAMIPSILTLFLLIIQIAIYGVEVFKHDDYMVSDGWFDTVFVYGLIIFEIILGICTMVFTVIGVSEVHKISIWESVLSLLMPFLIILVPILIFVLLS